MPTSDPRQIPAILGEVQRLEPLSVLDAGAGWGKYGVLLREYVDEWRGELILDAVEGFPDYLDRSGLGEAAYNELIVADLADWDPGRRVYDVVLLVDVLEHFEEAVGRALLRKLLACCAHLVVATPREPSDQWDVEAGGYPYGNGLEAHMSQWTEEKLIAAGRVVRFVPVPGDDQIVVTFRGLA